MRESSYDFLLVLCTSHPVVGVNANPTPSHDVTASDDVTADRNSDVIGSSNVTARRAGIADRVRHQLRILLLRGLRDPDSEGIDDAEKEAEKEGEGEVEENIGAMDVDIDSGQGEGVKSKGRIGIRRRVFDFFNDQFGLSTDPYVRLHALMTQLFEPTRTDSWLLYSTYLLISMSKRNKEEYSKFIHPRQLVTDSLFTDLNLTNKTGGRNLDFSLPLFSMERTQSSQSQDQYNNNTGIYGTQSTENSVRRIGQIRGTQEVSWMQTQNFSGISKTGLSKSDFEFRNPLSTQSLFTPGISNTMGTQVGGRDRGQSQFLGMLPPSGLPSYMRRRNISTVTQRVPKRYRIKPPSSSSSSSSYSQSYDSSTQNKGSYSDSTAESDENSYSEEGKKYKKSSNSSTSNYSLVAARMASKQAEDKLKRASKIIVYRKYKEGELPDICLPLSDLLKPLQGLCLRDTRAASTLFCTLFDSLYQSVTLDSPQATLMRSDIATLLSTTNSQNAHFAATMLRSSLLCLESEDPRSTQNKGKTPPGRGLLVFSRVEDITEAALRSLHFHAGIRYLEQLLVVNERINICTQDVIMANKTKKSRKSSAKMDIEDVSISHPPRDEKVVLRHLSRLYSALGESDVLLGLAERVGAYPKQTRKAIDAEVCGDYRKAVQLYGELFDMARKR